MFIRTALGTLTLMGTGLFSVPAHAADDFRLALGSLFPAVTPAGPTAPSLGPQYGALDLSCSMPAAADPDSLTDPGAQPGTATDGSQDRGWTAAPCNAIDAFRNNGASGESITYLSPAFGRFQLSLSWHPSNTGHPLSLSGGQPSAPAQLPAGQHNVVDLYAGYARDFGDWRLNWGAGGSWTLSDDQGTPSNDTGQSYQSGLNLTFGNLSIGGGGQYYRNGIWPNGNAWIVGGGAAYRMEDWTFGLQYNYGDVQVVGPSVDGRVNAVVATGQYEMQPGIALNAMVEFGWVKEDKADNSTNDYETYGIGIGTSFQF